MKMIFGTLKGLDGLELKNGQDVILIDKTLANLIINDNARDNILQRYELATKLFNANGQEVEITASEKEIIKAVANSGNLSILLAAQVLNIINNA